MQSLANSFQRLGQAVDCPKVAWRLIAMMLAVHSALLMYSAYIHSPTLNEPGHLVAGLSHWKFGRFELYRVNPPLVRMVAALPVMAVGYEEDWSGYYEGPDARPVFDMGEDFVVANGERTLFLTMIARWMCIPFSWLGAIVCYLWGRGLHGRVAGLISCFIWCFEPNILAHASLLTADAHATALGLAACYTFWRWLKEPTWTQAALTGVILGLAELAKTTLILLYPLWPLLWLIYRWRDRAQMTVKKWLIEGGMLVMRIAIGLYIVNLGYGFAGSFQPLGDFHFVSELFTGETKETAQSEIRYPQTDYQPTANRFANTPLEHLPAPFPKDYLLGIDIQQKDFEHYGRPFYLAGEWSDEGWWYYYLYAGTIKAPLGLLLLVGLRCICPILACAALPNGTSSKIAASRDTMILLTPAVVVFCVVSSKTGINEHFRYVLPAFPFLFIWLGGVAGVLTKNASKSAASSRGRGATRSVDARVHLRCGGNFLLAWLATSSVWIYPHSLSYFNEAIGGPQNGAEHLLGSNLDWGQDLRYLDATLRASSRHRGCYISLFATKAPVLYDLAASNAAMIREQSINSGAVGERKARIPACHIMSVNVLKLPKRPDVRDLDDSAACARLAGYTFIRVAAPSPRQDSL
ncbi:MAG: glycosyltransferase family 39 protein [Pseudomonadota bacterium]